MESNTGITMEQVFQLIAKMSEDNQKNAIEMVKEFKRPSAEEQVKIDAQNLKLKNQQEARVKLAMAEEEGKKARQRSCPHGTTHEGTGSFKHQWRAQVHTPHGEKPYFIPTCTQCHTQLPKIYATTDQVQNGVNLDAYKAIDLARLTEWAKQSQTLAA